MFVHQVAASPDRWSPLLGMALKVLPFIPRTGDWGESQDTGLDFMVCPGNQLSDVLKSPDWFTSLRGLVLQTTFSPSDPEPSLAWLYPPSLSVAPRLLNSPRDPLGGPVYKKVSFSCKGPETFLCSTYVPSPYRYLSKSSASEAKSNPELTWNPSQNLSALFPLSWRVIPVSLLPLLGGGSSKERSTPLCHSPEEFALLSLLNCFEWTHSKLVLNNITGIHVKELLFRLFNIYTAHSV